MKKLHFPEFNRLSLRSKLLFPVMGVTLLLLLLNLFMFLGTNHSIRNLDSVYESSIQINALEEATLETEKYFTDYMNTRSDDAFQHFPDFHGQHEGNDRSDSSGGYRKSGKSFRPGDFLPICLLLCDG